MATWRRAGASITVYGKIAETMIKAAKH